MNGLILVRLAKLVEEFKPVQISDTSSSSILLLFRWANVVLLIGVTEFLYALFSFKVGILKSSRLPIPMNLSLFPNFLMFSYLVDTT